MDDIIGKPKLPVPTNPSETTPLISSIVRFIVVIAGLFTLWQFLMGGLGYITAGGDKAKIQEAQQKIIMSILGMVIIAASFLIIGIVSQLLFGDFTYILNPKLQTL